jgi:hypothetical protein
MKYQLTNTRAQTLRKLLLAFVTSYFLLITWSPTFAQSGGAIGVTVSPITDEFSIKPGQVVSRTIQVINPNDRVITLYPVVLDFNTDNENGQPVFFKAGDESRNYTLSSWITFDREFLRIAKAEQELVKITIAAPADAEPGGHYGAVLFSTEKPELRETNDAEVSVVGLVGTLFLASVPGKVVEKLELEQFNLPLIALSPPVRTEAVFKNSGNVHVKPKGDIAVKNWSGNQVGTIEINAGSGNVLPESRRRFDGEWAFKPLTSFGLYSFSLSATYGKTPTELTATRKVLVIPYWLIVLLVAVAAWLGYRFWRKRRASSPESYPHPHKRLLQ